MNESTEEATGNQPGKFPWRIFWVLLLASLAGVGAAVPMILEVFPVLMRRAGPPPLSLPLLITVAAVQNSVLLGLAISLGLLLSRKLGLLGAPFLRRWLYHEPLPQTAQATLLPAALVGIAVGVVVLIPILIAAPYLPGLPFATAARVALWKRFLAGFYGGIVEEILSRLFLISLVGWLGVRIFQKRKTELSPRVFWAANVIVAILFGLGHLPSASLVMHITPAVVVLAVFLNAIPALSFGYLFWKRGLESAMIAHFAADFVLWVVGPTFLKTV